MSEDRILRPHESIPDNRDLLVCAAWSSNQLLPAYDAIDYALADQGLIYVSAGSKIHELLKQTGANYSLFYVRAISSGATVAHVQGVMRDLGATGSYVLSTASPSMELLNDVQDKLDNPRSNTRLAWLMVPVVIAWIIMFTKKTHRGT